MDTPEQTTETAPVATNTGTAKLTLHTMLLALVIGSPLALIAGATVAIVTDFHTFKVAAGINPPSSMVVKPIIIETPQIAQGGVK